MDIVRTMEKLGRDTGKPKAEVTIADCGQIVYQASQLSHVKGNVPENNPVPAALFQPAPEDAAVVRYRECFLFVCLFVSRVAFLSDP